MPLPSNWSATKKKWKSVNPPDKAGNYICWICTQPVHEDRMTLDHVAPAALYPEYAKNLSNLRPSHKFCNEQRAVPAWGKTTRFVKRKARR